MINTFVNNDFPAIIISPFDMIIIEKTFMKVSSKRHFTKSFIYVIPSYKRLKNYVDHNMFCGIAKKSLL